MVEHLEANLKELFKNLNISKESQTHLLAISTETAIIKCPRFLD
jgi:hypothetical protein